MVAFVLWICPLRFRPPGYPWVVGSGPTVTRATERNGRANAKNPTEPVSLMELRVTKCLKYHRLEQEGPVCKEWALWWCEPGYLRDCTCSREWKSGMYWERPAGSWALAPHGADWPPLLLPDHREKGREARLEFRFCFLFHWPDQVLKEEQLTAWARWNCYRTMAVWSQNRQGAPLQACFSRPSSLKKQHEQRYRKMWLPSILFSFMKPVHTFAFNFLLSVRYQTEM